MADQISEASQSSSINPNSRNESTNSETQRNTKPGSKRLFLSLIVLFSFLLASPFFMKSVEIYRSSLPFRDIDSLSNSIQSNPLNFPCHFRVLFLGFDHKSSTGLFSAEKLGFAISDQMRVLSNSNQACGSCSDNFTVSVTIDHGNECEKNQVLKNGCDWECGAVSVDGFYENLENVDEMLEKVMGSCGTVYSVVVVNKDDEEARAVVGKYRHAWIIGKVSEENAVSRVAEIFVKVFMNGGKEEGMIQSEFMPVGADGRIVLSFNLLNADPRDWIYDWDFRRVEEILLSPIIKALAPIANISVESQVLYHTPKSSFASWDDKLNAYVFNTKDLPFFLNSNEWHLDTSIAAEGRSKILQVAIYIPSAKECPLLLQLPNGEISRTNGFISPMWGGVIVLNPPGCLTSKTEHPAWHTISPQDLQSVIQIFLGQLRQLLGLKSENLHVGKSWTYHLLSSENGFTEWELDVLSRQHTCFNLHSCATTLGSLSRLVQSLPRMIILEEIGKQVKFSLEAAKFAQGNASGGIYYESAISSREARSLAEDAFFHPSIMSVSYYSFEHCFAVYSPFFLPVLLHVALAALRECRRYKQQKTKYLLGRLK